MKKLLSLCLAVLLFVLSGCSKPQSNGYNIAIVKLLDHESLDEIADAVASQLDEIAKANNTTISYQVYSGQGEANVLQQIGDEVTGGQFDAIIPIATLAAQIMVTSAEEKQIPVIFAAISDPESAELTGIPYVTGTSDALNTEVIMEMMLKANPNLKKVGLLYSQSEKNSEKPIAEAEAYLQSKNIEVIKQTGNNNAEIEQATSALIQAGVEAVFTPTDNIVMATEASVAEKLNEAGIPHYTGADSFVRLGALATCGVNYTDLGKATANYAYEALTKGFSQMQDYYLMDGGFITVNTETAELLKIDPSVFNSFGTLIEIQTQE